MKRARLNLLCKLGFHKYDIRKMLDEPVAFRVCDRSDCGKIQVTLALPESYDPWVDYWGDIAFVPSRMKKDENR